MLNKRKPNNYLRNMYNNSKHLLNQTCLAVVSQKIILQNTKLSGTFRGSFSYTETLHE